MECLTTFAQLDPKQRPGIWLVKKLTLASLIRDPKSHPILAAETTGRKIYSSTNLGQVFEGLQINWQQKD